MKKVVAFALIFFYCVLLVSPIVSFSYSYSGDNNITLDGITYQFHPSDNYFYGPRGRVSSDLNKTLIILSSYVNSNEYVYSLLPIRYNRETYRIYYFTVDKNLKDNIGEIFSSSTDLSNFGPKKVSFVIILDSRNNIVKDEDLFETLCKEAGAYADFNKVAGIDRLQINLPSGIDDFLYSKDWEDKLLSNFIFAQQKANSLLKTKKSRYEEALRVFLTQPFDKEKIEKFNKQQSQYLANKNAFKNVKNLKEAYKDFFEVAKNSYLYGKQFRDMARANLKIINQIPEGATFFGSSAVDLILALSEQFVVVNEKLSLLRNLQEEIKLGKISVNNDFESALDSVIKETESEVSREDRIIFDIVKGAVNEFGVNFVIKKTAKNIATIAFKEFGPNSIIGHTIASAVWVILLGYTISDLLINLSGMYDNFVTARYIDESRKNVFEIIRSDYKDVNKAKGFIDGNIVLRLNKNYTTYVNLTSLVYYEMAAIYENSRAMKDISNILKKVFSQPSTKDMEKYFISESDFYRKNSEQFNSMVLENIAYKSFIARKPKPFTPVNSFASSDTVIVLDVSGSMERNWHGGIKINSAKKAALSFFNLLNNENEIGGNNRVSLIVFSDSAEVVFNLTKDLSNAESYIDNISPGGRTNIGDALTKAENEFNKSKTGNKFIILMTDGKTNEGMSADEILNNLVPEIASKKIKVYTIGFGDKNDIDENLLKEIATDTGGKYYYADNAMELMNLYIRLRHSSMGKIQGEFKGTISQGEKKTVGTINVLKGTGELNCTLSWSGCKLDLMLEDPHGRVVDSNYPGATFFNDANPVYTIIKNPIPGNWKVGVYGESIPEGTTQFDVIISSRASSPGSSNTNSIFIILLFLILGAFIAVIAVLLVNNSGSKPITPKLLCTAGALAGLSFPLIKTFVYLGRDRQNDVVIPDSLVSRKHCLIYKTPNGYFIKDLNSKNGTYVNGKKISTAVMLENGAEIKIGKTVFIFNLIGRN